MTSSCERITDTLIVHLPMEIDHHSSSLVQEEVDGWIRGGTVRRVLFDFSGTQFMDSSGVGMVLGRYKKVRERGGEVGLYGASPRIKRLLRISGIGRIVQEWDTREQALRGENR